MMIREDEIIIEVVGVVVATNPKIPPEYSGGIFG